MKPISIKRSLIIGGTVGIGHVRDQPEEPQIQAAENQQNEKDKHQGDDDFAHMCFDPLPMAGGYYAKKPAV
jgi:hypothetical protein